MPLAWVISGLVGINVFRGIYKLGVRLFLDLNPAV